MSLFNKTRCKICKEERAVRHCLRKNKQIGWECCNSMRFDHKCPTECEYHIPKNEGNSLAFKFKSDSLKETNDVVLRLFDIWTLKTNSDFNNKSPKELSESQEGRDILESYFAKTQFLNTLPINEMRSKLKLSPIEYKKANDFEEYADSVMEVLSQHNWDAFIEMYHNNEQILKDENKKRYIKRNKAFRAFKKISSYKLISSSLNKEGSEALCHFDINNKAEITLNIVKIDGEWRLKSRILGNPQLYYGEDSAIKHIAGLINKNEIEDVFNLCNRYSKIYPDSADIEYYWGLFHSLQENVNEARKHFQISYIIDPDFVEPLYNLGFIKQVERKDQEALAIYKEVLSKNPNEVKSLNNIAIMHIAKEEWEDAIEILEKCLKLNPDYDIAKRNIELIKKKIAERDEQNK